MRQAWLTLNQAILVSAAIAAALRTLARQHSAVKAKTYRSGQTAGTSRRRQQYSAMPTAKAALASGSQTAGV